MLFGITQKKGGCRGIGRILTLNRSNTQEAKEKFLCEGKKVSTHAPSIPNRLLANNLEGQMSMASPKGHNKTRFCPESLSPELHE